jgi:hypothetical protein
LAAAARSERQRATDEKLGSQTGQSGQERPKYAPGSRPDNQVFSRDLSRYFAAYLAWANQMPAEAPSGTANKMPGSG